MSVQGYKEDRSVMSEGYWDRWNAEVDAKIERDIEANRKADAVVALDTIPAGAEVRVEQVDHGFIFGAHIFNFDQLGTDERNTTYKDLFGTLFNSATIAFYWKTLEPEEGKPRFEGEFKDTAEFWNTVEEPKKEPHWRRPATDPVVAFCESKGIRLHGHTLAWGSSRWNLPEWLLAKLPETYRKQVLPFDVTTTSSNATAKIFDAFTPAQIEALLPEFSRELNNAMARRFHDIILRYKGRLQSWDVCNESATDFEQGRMIPGDAICKSTYGLMPGDYTNRAFKLAESVFPKEVKLNINDYNLRQCYPDQVKDLQERGCKIDILGAQMHLFDPQMCQDIADGTPNAHQSPEDVFVTMDRLSAAGLPLHLSEITITAPGNDEEGQAIQAIVARNLYRLWFSVKAMMGITWWNIVDDCGAPGEPNVSGIFTRDMQPKTAYHALNDLIHNEWKTRTVVTAGVDGKVIFRGFRGTYRLTWVNASGEETVASYELK